MGGRPAPGAARRRPARAHRVDSAAHERFRQLDRYRVEREWKRYEGTPQRDLFRDLRVRFLDRHRSSGGWSVDLGSGPGRFSAHVGHEPQRTVLLDLSAEMLRFAREMHPAPASLPAVRADALAPPFRSGSFSTVAALGNPLGFSGGRSAEFLDRAAELVRPGGRLLLEAVCGPGESSQYLRRLPAGAVRRLLSAPVNLVRSRLQREGFRREPERKTTGAEFRRYSPVELTTELRRRGLEVEEAVSVAPCLGSDAERVAAVRGDALAWLHLLELEEAMGRLPERQTAAAALLLAARRGDPAPLESE